MELLSIPSISFGFEENVFSRISRGIFLDSSIIFEKKVWIDIIPNSAFSNSHFFTSISCG